MLEPNKKCCTTCPFLKGGWNMLAPFLTERALTEATPICHSTGPLALKKPAISEEPRACRGARDIQLRYFTSCGFISEPTDKAWAEKCKELGI